MNSKFDNETMAQIQAQCKAVAHMASVIANLHTDKAKLFTECPEAMQDIADFTGARTASLLETLGDILNGMDAVDSDEDGWINPIILEAQKRWPAEPKPPAERA